MTTPGTVPTYAEVMQVLGGYKNYERVSDYKVGYNTLGTERIEGLLDILGNPQKTLPAVHIAGTKGKGSVAHLTASIFAERDMKVGLFTSPHLVSPRERIIIDGEIISEEKFCESFAVVMPAVEKMKEHPTLKPPTYFETMTSMALVAFAQAKCDVVVMETGLGGRLDATNISTLPVKACAITGISMDHTKQLGDDLISIAGEKAGILREGVPVMIGRQEAGVARFLRKKAAETGSPSFFLGSELTAELEETPPSDMPEAPQRITINSWHARHVDIPLPLLGEHQVDNAGVAVGLAELFFDSQERAPLGTLTVRKAWRDVFIPGRVEIMERAPWLILDGAHNAASCWALAETLSKRFPSTERTLVFSAASDKKVNAMLRILAPLFSKIIITTFDSPRCFDPQEAVQMLGEKHDPSVEVETDTLKALELARSSTERNGLICVTGSLYLVGNVRSLLRPED